ncbi:MAG: Smr/MutS family protein [Clostridia bacterium]|nr:Smr/MutS family protein [Clostridia bacterium]
MENRYCKLQGSNKIYLIEKHVNNQVILSSGNVKVKTDVNNITLLPEDFVPQKRNVKSTVIITSENVPNEIMLRHKFKDEAIAELDKYIDQAIVAKLGRIRIIHGRHGGVLRDAVHEYLQNHPYVKEFEMAGYGEGGIGVTVAVLAHRTK